MILTGDEILKQVKTGAIKIAPFVAENINPNSYNYHLGDTLLEITDTVIDPMARTKHKKIKLTSSGFTLLPGKLYLGSTMEQIGSDHYVTSLIGRSSVGRLGLFLQITADLGQLGAKHHWTLELTVVQPVRVYPGMKIGQVSFWAISGEKEHNYRGKYRHHSKPHPSKFHKELTA